MLIKTTKASDIKESEVCDEGVYYSRRKFIKQAAAGTGLLAASSLYLPTSLAMSDDPVAPAVANAKSSPVVKTKQNTLKFKKTQYGTKLKSTPYEYITGYNNFYELGTGKSDPARNAEYLKTEPWSITVEGQAEVTGKFNFEDILKRHSLQERIYRLRCVEAWSMVVPWVGFPLADLIKYFKPNSKAKYVEFQTLYNPKLLPGQNRRVLDWPYTEALRIDEAMNSLSFMAVGIYGKQILNQNGAPIRLVVPWKYGFKNIKSIVKIRFVEKLPRTSWWKSAPQEYGFYANVNPAVDHPRWTQKRERIIGTYRRRKTELFNGYSEEVASMYSGLDLKKNI